MKVISLRQPWPWFIFAEAPWWKDIENRDWPCPREVIGHDVLIHAAKTVNKRDFDEACQFALEHCRVTKLPRFDELKRGGIVGVVSIVKCVRMSTNPWFVGKFGFVLEDPYPLPFEPMPGQLGFFEKLSTPKHTKRQDYEQSEG